MGLVMSPGSVVAQLNQMNKNLQEGIGNAALALGDVTALQNTESVLTGESYDSVRAYYSTLHVPLLQGMILFAQMLIQENNSYKSCIQSHLAGIGYIDEDELERDKENIQRQINHVYSLMSVSKLSYSSYLGCLQNALALVEKKLRQIDDFLGASAGLYAGMDSYQINIRNGLKEIGGKHFDRATGKYDLAAVKLGWKKKILTDVRGDLMTKSVETTLKSRDTSSEKVVYSVEYQAARLAGVGVNNNGMPCINSGYEYMAYANALRLLRKGTIKELPLNVNGEIKRYEDYRKLSDTTSSQYQLQQLAYTDEFGFRRIQIEELDKPVYMVAMGSYYTNYVSEGTVFAVTLENGTVFCCIAGDMKADIHTNETNQYTYLPEYGITENNADIIEFIMDVDNEYAKELLPEGEGGKGYGILNNSASYEAMSSPVSSIVALDIQPVLMD